MAAKAKSTTKRKKTAPQAVSGRAGSIVEKAIDMHLHGMSMQKIEDQTGLAKQNLSILMRMEGCPEDQAARRDLIRGYIELCTLKATRRLAESIDEMPVDKLPVTMGILVDKLLTFAGEPTAITANINAKFSVDEIRQRIMNRSSVAKGTPAAPADHLKAATPGEGGDQVAESPPRDG